jgi:hypothetical protein
MGALASALAKAVTEVAPEDEEIERKEKIEK